MRGWVNAAIATLGVVALTLFVLDEDTESTMFALATAGLLVGRSLGMSDRWVVALAAASALLVTLVLTGLVPSRATSTIAHVVIGGFLACGLSEADWARRPAARQDPGRRVLVVVAVVVALALGWEIGEQLIDQLIGTAIEFDPLQIFLDLLAGAAGALLGALVAVRYRRAAGGTDDAAHDASSRQPVETGGPAAP